MAGLIPQSFINDLLDRVDIVDIIDTRLQLKKAGKNYQALCPFHSEKSPSFSVSPDKQFYHCFGCGMSGTALTFLMEHDRLEFVEAVETLAASVGLEVPREAGRRVVGDGNAEIYQLLDAASTFYQQQLRQAPVAIEYLKGRGVTGVVAKEFAIGYAPPGWDAMLKQYSGKKKQLLAAGLVIENDKGRTYDRFRERVLFPIRDTRGRTIGFGGRVMRKEDTPKYLNSPETPVFQKGKELYGLYEARRAVRQLERLLVVEGYMDVVALAQHGIPYAVASLGTATSTTHFQKMYRNVSEVVCCFDGDNAGRQAAWRALENALPALEDGRQLKFMFLPDGEDPDTLVRSQGKEHIETLVGNAISGLEYLFNQLTSGLDMESMDGRARLASLAEPHINKVPDGVLKQLMRQRLGELTGLRSTAGQDSGNAQQSSKTAPAPQASPSGAARPPRRSASRLQARLLVTLLKAPDVINKIEADLQQRLVGLPVEDLLGDVVRYVVSHPKADGSQILASWVGEPDHALLLQYSKRPLEVGFAVAQEEFSAGALRYIAAEERHQVKAVLARLQADPTPDNLRRYWQLMEANRKGSGSGGNLGGVQDPVEAQ